MDRPSERDIHRNRQRWFVKYKGDALHVAHVRNSLLGLSINTKSAPRNNRPGVSCGNALQDGGLMDSDGQILRP